MLFYTDSFGADRNALGEAITRLLQLARHSGQAAIASHQLANFDEGSAISRVLSSIQHEAFKKYRIVTLNDVEVFMMTKRNDAGGFVRGPILALHVSLPFLQELMSDNRADDFIFVPWSEEERDSFKTDYASAVSIPFTSDPGY